MAEEAYTMTEGKQLLKIAGITVAVYILMKYFLPYVIPFFISYILVHLLKPVTELIHKKLRLRREVILSVLLAALLMCDLEYTKVFEFSIRGCRHRCSDLYSILLGNTLICLQCICKDSFTAAFVKGSTSAAGLRSEILAWRWRR